MKQKKQKVIFYEKILENSEVFMKNTQKNYVHLRLQNQGIQQPELPKQLD